MDDDLGLGFGCSVLGGDLSRARQRALLEAALGAGFRYFDVAPSYGGGQAEQVLGEALAGVRAGVTVATKVGIGHPAQPTGFGLARRLLRPLKALAPGVWRQAAQRARRATAARGRFSPAEVQSTLAESLRRLGMDHVDRLLLHEVTPPDIGDDLLATLRALLSSGQVGEVGLGTTVESTGPILASHAQAFDFAQVDHYWGAFGAMASPAPERLITHRCLRNGLALVRLPAFMAVVAAHARAAELRRLLADETALPELLLTAGLLANPGCRVLVSSSDPARVRQFAAWARAPALKPEAAALNDCLRRVAAPGRTFAGTLGQPHSTPSQAVA